MSRLTWLFLAALCVFFASCGGKTPDEPLKEATSTLPILTQTPLSATATVLPATATPTSTPSASVTPTPLALATSTPVASSREPAEALLAGFTKVAGGATIQIEGEYAVIRTNGVPEHPSPYFPRSDTRHQAYNGSNPNYGQNPNQIVPQNLTFRIPVKPKQADTHQATPLGPIGVAINGVPLFNQLAGPGRLLTFEINSFDQYNGHPQMTGMYHYHVEPLYLTAIYGRDALLGFLLDGFPVYGTQENGRLISNSDLDELHGHSHATKEYPQGIYHYHVTAEAPYINGIGFYGTPGSVAVR